MYPDSFLAWFLGLFVVFGVTIGVTMLAYYVGNRFGNHRSKKDKEDKHG